MKKIIRTLVILLLVGIIGFAAYIYFLETKKRDVFTVIPKDAIYIIETDNLTEGWEALRSSTIWHNLTSNEYFEDIHSSAVSLDSLIHGDKKINKILSDKKLMISAHMLGSDDFDFLFAIDIQQASKLGFLKDYIESILNIYDYTMEKQEYKTSELMVLTHMKDGDVLYLSFIDNILICSYAESIIKSSIDISQSENNWTDDMAFKTLKSELSSSSLFRFYLNYSYLQAYAQYYLQEQDDNLAMLCSVLRHTAWNINFESERFSMDGFTSLKDTNSYFHAMLGVKPGERKADKILSDQTAIYLSICFEDYMEFYQNISTQFSSEDTTTAENYQKNMQRIEKLFKINIEEDFFSWIGSEIAFCKMRPNINTKEKDALAIIHTKDIDLAKEKMGKMLKQIKRRSPLKTKQSSYRNYEIHYFGINGFFKLFFGKLFRKLEKPYFIYMEDFLLFSNNPSLLMDMIDDYEEQRLLALSEEYQAFKAEMQEQSNVSVFVHTPKLYSLLYYFNNEKQRKNIQKNKELIVSFVRIAFQMTSNGEFFKTTLLAEHDINALYDDDMEQFQTAAEDVFLKRIDSLQFKIEFKKKETPKDGPFVLYYQEEELLKDSIVQHKGRIEDGKINGFCRSYYESGNLYCVVEYEDSKLEGRSIFYYDNPEQNMLAIIFFKDNLIVDAYKEFYSNGKIKALIEFKKGLPHGDVEFYYERGALKLSGKYKKGLKAGKWKYYTETGEPYKKTKHKDGRIVE